MKTALRLFVLLFLTLSIFAQDRQYGLIVPNDLGDDDLCCIFAPKDGFSIYNKPNGDKIGLITRNVKSYEGNTDYKMFFVDDAGESEIDLKYFKEIGYEVLSMTFFERKDGFIRIVSDSVRFWIEEKEIMSKDFKVIDWQDFYFEMSDKLLGFYADSNGLDVKAEPTGSSKTKKTISGDLFEIHPTNKIYGNWTYVKIMKYKVHPCIGDFDFDDAENIEFEIEGWIEVVGNEGQPNLWFYSRGC